jgi:hypothetical protein
MISLADLITQINHQHDLLTAQPIEPDTLSSNHTPPTQAPTHHVDLDMLFTTRQAQRHECRVSSKHECYTRKYGAQEGVIITLWSYLQYPEVRARSTSRNVRRFRRVKKRYGNGMGNGSSPLKFQVWRLGGRLKFGLGMDMRGQSTILSNVDICTSTIHCCKRSD